jgi:2-polyprenyl-6-methoxyphenol hydroxylase-like FAD-dependent oxidoreductase
MRVLISGAGIAGPTLAYWLTQYGMEPTLIERAPALRTGGYVVDFWGAGFDIADRMGLLPDLRTRGYFVNEVRVVNSSGRRISGFSAGVFARLTGGRYISIPRGDLAASIFALIDGKVETIFGDTINRIEQNASGVRVAFERGQPRQFDLVIGADGLHSKVRELTFGPQGQFEKYMGYKVAAFATSGYRPRDELTYIMYTRVGQQVGRFAMHGDRTMFLFIFADDQPQQVDLGDMPAQKAQLRRAFENSGWECPRILDALDAADRLYFDRISQILMSPDQGSWTRGRVTLLGDAAFCVSLLGGQGCALAMVAAYILAGELHRAGVDYAQAFSRYQQLFGPFVAGKQKAAERFAGSFAPGSPAGLFVRNQVMKMLAFPWVANWVFRRGLMDEIALPEYS